jgi:antitoxin (DNA-binding transcriptional repressor) of toxin-antitoxin stability system
MTIQIDIAGENPIAELLAQIDAGEEVLLTRDGETVAIVRKPDPPVKRSKRVPGAWAHLGKLQDPDLFLRPDPELEELAESRDEDHFYR